MNLHAKGIFRLRSGSLDFFVSSFSLIRLFSGIKIWLHLQLPVTNLPEYPRGFQDRRMSVSNFASVGSTKETLEEVNRVANVFLRLI